MKKVKEKLKIIKELYKIIKTSRFKNGFPIFYDDAKVSASG